jgi:hypothetical protein
MPVRTNWFVVRWVIMLALHTIAMSLRGPDVICLGEFGKSLSGRVCCEF